MDFCMSLKGSLTGKIPNNAKEGSLRALIFSSFNIDEVIFRIEKDLKRDFSKINFIMTL